MSILSKAAHPMRIIALPLAKIQILPGAKLDPTNALLVFYYFDLVSPNGLNDPSWHKKVLKDMTDRAADVWTGLGKAPKGSWKLWTYELGERMADKIDFEELTLRNVDPSLGPPVSTETSLLAQQVHNARKYRSPSHSFAKIPFIYPPSLYPVGTDHAAQLPLAHLWALLASRMPHHRRGCYLWTLITPLTIPVTLIPIIPNFPLFFCVWRSWSHYRAYRSSRYLSCLLDRGLIEPNPSLELDMLYASFTSSAALASRSLEKTPTSGNVTSDRKSEAASGTGSSQPGRILLTHEAMSRIIQTFHFPESAAKDVYHAMSQAHARLGNSR